MLTKAGFISSVVKNLFPVYPFLLTHLRVYSVCYQFPSIVRYKYIGYSDAKSILVILMLFI